MRHLWGKPVKDIFIALIFAGVIVFLVFSAIWAFRQYKNSPPYVDPEKYPVRGIDISRHNGLIDFEKVKNDGMEFVFIKASEGSSSQDSLYSRNFDEARKAGLKTGAYHFFRFDREGVDQAVNFVNAVGPQIPEMGLVIDVEKTGNPDSIPTEIIKERLVAMVDYLNLLGFRIMFYTNHDGYYDFLDDTFPGFPLWICRFKENPIYAEWSFWQFDHHGKVAGINGEVDLNAFCGSREEWQRFLQGEIWPYSGKQSQRQ